MEGEMLGVAWALHDTRFFTLGCRDLHIQTDHCALVKLLGDKRLEDIDNNRLVNLKEKTMPWSFTISWIPGKEIPAPDATSRQPQATTEEDDGFRESLAAVRLEADDNIDMAGDKEFAAYGRLKAGEIAAVTWDRVQEETWLDESMRHLVGAIKGGLNNMSLEEAKDGLADYWRHRHSLNIVDGVHISAATTITRSIAAPGVYSGPHPFEENSSWQKNAATLRQLHTLRERVRALEKK